MTAVTDIYRRDEMSGVSHVDEIVGPMYYTLLFVTDHMKQRNTTTK